MDSFIAAKLQFLPLAVSTQQFICRGVMLQFTIWPILQSFAFLCEQSKCDQFGIGIEVFMGKNGKPVCLVAVVLAYLSSCGDAPGQFFKTHMGNHRNDKFCVYAGGLERLYKYGLASQLICGHSLQIGFVDSVITQGRWFSATFLLYTCMPWELITPLSARIASACS